MKPSTLILIAALLLHPTNAAPMTESEAGDATNTVTFIPTMVPVAPASNELETSSTIDSLTNPSSDTQVWDHRPVTIADLCYVSKQLRLGAVLQDAGQYVNECFWPSTRKNLMTKKEDLKRNICSLSSIERVPAAGLEFLHQGMVFAKPEQNAAQRSALAGFFKVSNISNLKPYLVQEAEHWSDRLKVQGENILFSGKAISDQVFETLLCMFIKVAMGVSPKQLETTNLSDYAAHFLNVVSIKGTEWPAVLRPFMYSNEKRKSLAAWYKLLDDIVVTKKISNETLPFETLLDGMIHYANSTDDSLGALRQQFMTMIIAAHENSRATFLWIIWLLARRQDIQDELREALKNNDKDVSSQIEQLIKDALHLGNIEPLLERVVTDDNVQLMDLPFPRGSSVYMNWPTVDAAIEIEQFDKRTERSEKLPFGHGKRGCIGKALAMAQLETLVRVIVPKWHISTKSKNLDYCYVLMSREPRVDIEFSRIPTDAESDAEFVDAEFVDAVYYADYDSEYDSVYIDAEE